jgi:SAM-dependent methyltransferase
MKWKTRLYNGYVSSGQASVAESRLSTQNPERVFQSRAPYIRSVIARHLPQERTGRIVDLACGYGAFLYYLRAAGYTNVSGVDISQEQIDVAHKLGVREAKCSDMLTELNEITSESIDAVLMMDVLEHLENDELFEVLDQVFRVTKKNGVCVAHVPNAEGIYGMRIRYGDLTHERAFAPKAAQQLFRTIGFKDVRCFEDRPQIHGLKSLTRRFIWSVGTVGHRVLLSAETGSRGFILSQNMLLSARK